jgi:hypothetical protein
MLTEPDTGVEMLTVSAVITRQMKADLLTLGNGNLSAGLRAALAAPTSTPSGARWVARPGQLPAPDRVTGPAVIVCEAGLICHGIGAATLVADSEAGELVLLDGSGDGTSSPLDLQALASLAGSMPAAVLASLNADGPDLIFLPAGLEVRRMTRGVVSIGTPELVVVLPVRTAIQLAAEVCALLARRVEATQRTIGALEQTLTATPARLEVDA